jgi:hypothetical protein
MAASDYTLLAEYVRQPVVKDRNYVGLANWAASVTAQPIPTEQPDEEWVKARIVAERFPAQPQNYVDRTISYFLQDPATQTNIRTYLNAWNTEAAETSIAAQIDGVITAFMPRFADIDVTSAQVEQWLADNGFPAATAAED